MTVLAQQAPLDADYDNFPDFGETQEPELGEVYWDGEGRAYKFVEFNTDVDVAAGESVEYADIQFDSSSTIDDPNVTGVTVSGQTSGGGNAIDDATAGVVVADHSASTDGSARYGWIQVYGPCQNLVDSSNGVAKGDYVMPDSTNDGEWTTATTDAEYRAGAIALEGASSGTFNAFLLMR